MSRLACLKKAECNPVAKAKIETVDRLIDRGELTEEEIWAFVKIDTQFIDAYEELLGSARARIEAEVRAQEKAK